jgi:TM2 domain-containing membrane protein YozV
MAGEVLTGDKSPTAALLLQLCCGWFWIFGCLGYFYIGQWQKALVMVAFSLIGVGLILWIITVIDVFLQAKNLHEGKGIGHWTFFSQAA